ncbi:F-box protein CPR1-like protein [Tanacetum coccineum]
MTELGRDIHEEILLRLEVNDLIRCKSVCKSWNSLISDPRFVKSQLKRQHSNELGDTRIIVSDGASSRCDNCFYLGLRKCRLVGSSNGLVCISCYDTKFLVVNPSTREVKELINFPESSYNTVFVSGFGYDSSIDDFKVVIGHRCNPNDYLELDVLELKTNIWRSVVVESDYEYLAGNGILCNGALHWLHRKFDYFGIVSFDLSKEVFKKIPLPKLDDEWNLGTMKDRLCVFRFPNTDLKEIEIWVMRNDQVSWERKLPPPGYDANKTTMVYSPHRPFLSGHVHIWLKEEGSGAPVLVRSIDYPHREYHEHIRLSTYSECNYNYDEHVFVKSLVSPHAMGNENGSCNEERVKRKRQNVISPDGDGRSMKSRSESPVSHNSDGGRAKKTKQSLLFHDADCDGDGRRVEKKMRERESHVFHSSDKGSAKSKRESHVYSDSDDDGRRVEGKRRERESHVFHSSDKGSAKSKRQSHVYSDSDDDGMRVEGKRRERESHVFHSSDKGRAKTKRQSLVSSDSGDDGRRVERKRRESYVFHSSDKGRAKIRRQSLVCSDSDDDGRRVERKRRERERESLVFHSSDGGRAKSKTQRRVSSDSDDDERRGERTRRERESLVFHSSDGGRAKSKRQSLVSYDSDGDGRRVERKRRERDRESLVFHSSDKRIAKSKRQSLVSSDSNGVRRRVDMRRRERRGR